MKTPKKGSKTHQLLFMMNKIGWASNKEHALLLETNRTNIRQMFFSLDKNLPGWREKRVWREETSPIRQSSLSEAGRELLERIEAQ